MRKTIYFLSLLVTVLATLLVPCRAFYATAPASTHNLRTNTGCCFSSNNNDDDENEVDNEESPLDPSRRNLFLLGTGGVIYGKLVGDALSRLARGNVYPMEHEEQVQATFRTAILEVAKSPPPSSSNLGRRPLRILEVGVGSDCRVASRGLYGTALDELILLASGGGASKTPSEDFPFSGVEILGVDLKKPKAAAIEKARESLVHPDGCILPSFRVSFDAQEGDLMAGLPFADGSFDCVLCAFTLCSVQDQEPALEEIRRLVNPKGGTFGYVEHVAVDLDTDSGRDLLELQQTVLDPVQQVVADNCHLHRSTAAAIADVFHVGDKQAKAIEQNRFFVDDMWPVSCQCSGVLQRLA